MSVLRLLLRNVVRLLRIIFYEWTTGIPKSIEMIRRIMQRCRDEKRIDVRKLRATRAPCIPVDDPAYKRPDPLIYAQFYLMKMGLAVTWDNPDIALQKNGVTVPSSQLDADTEYEIVARIWNNSTEAPVVGMPVYFAYLSFGVGTVSNPIGKTTIDVGVKGGADHPALTSIKWKTPGTPGHYCIQVWFLWADDMNPQNNYGQENTNIGIAQSPATFEFTLRNDTKEEQTYRFTVDTYQIPRQDPCSDKDDKHTAHQQEKYPVPDGWSVAITPQNPQLSPGSEQMINVEITPPGTFKGKQAFNINSFHRQGLAGGVTLEVEKN